MASTAFRQRRARASRRTHISMIVTFTLAGVILSCSLAFWLLPPPAKGSPFAPLWRIQEPLQNACITAMFGLFALVQWCQHQDWRRGTARLISHRLVIGSRWVLALSLLFSIFAVSLGIFSVLTAYGVISDYSAYAATLYGVLTVFNLLSVMLCLLCLLFLPTDA